MGTRAVFEIGERVVHPVHGAGRITDIKFQSVGGESRKYYVIRKAEGLRDLGWRRHHQRLPAEDERAFKRLGHLLAGEIALALGVGFDEASVLLEDSMEKSFSESTQQGESG